MDEADKLIGDLMRRLWLQTCAMKALHSLADGPGQANSQELRIDGEALAGLVAIMEEHCRETCVIADKLEAVMWQAEWPKAA